MAGFEVTTEVKKGKKFYGWTREDFGGSHRTFKRVAVANVKRDWPWFMPPANATREERRKLAAFFFKELWRRAQHTKNPRAAYERFLLIAEKFWVSRMSPAMIAAESCGELTIEQVKSVIKRLKKPPEGWSYEEQMANFNNAH